MPSDSHEYGGSDGATLLWRTHTDYNLAAAYLGQHIIGLVAVQFAYGRDELGVERLVSKVDYQYDWGGEFLQSQGTPVQHDAVSYGSSFITGRGNVTSMRRYDVNVPGDAAQAAEYKTAYNQTGSVIFTRDPLNHQTTFSYTDLFSDEVNRNTFAYPTTVTDADNFASEIQYNYDHGQVTRTKGPPPQGPPPGYTHGVIQTISYDAAGRLQRRSLNNGAFTIWVYPLMSDN